jgi:hypothetical protein
VSAETPAATTPEEPTVQTPRTPEVAQAVSDAIARGEAAAAAVAAKAAEPKPKEKPVEKVKPVPAPTAAEIEADIEAARERLTSTLVQLEDAVTPASFARRAKTSVRNAYIDEFGGVRIKNVAITAGVVVGAIVFIKIIK